MRTLKLYHKGEDVRYWQYLCKSQYGQDLKTDGDFGTITQNITKAVQRLLGLDDDGLVGPLTQNATGFSDYIVHIYDLKDVQFAGTPYNNKRTSAYPTYTLKQWAGFLGADKVYNLVEFNVTGKDSKGNTHDQYGVIKGRTIRYLRADGYDCGYGGLDDRVIIDTGNICGGQFTVIRGGKRVGASGVSAAINANGNLKDGRYIHIQSITNKTPNELSTWVLANYPNIKTLIVQDYRGSTGYYDKKHDCLIAGNREGSNGRAVASVAYVIGAEPDKTITVVQVCPCCGQEIKGVM